MVAILLLAALYHFVKYFKEKAYVVFYTIITCVVLLFFDGFQGSRYLLAIAPFLIAYGIYEVLQHHPIQKGMQAILVGIAFTMGLYNLCAIYAYCTHTIETNYMYQKPSQEMYAYVRNEIKEDASIYFMRPRILYYETDKNCFGGEIETADVIFMNADYLVLYKDRFDYTDFKQLCLNRGYHTTFTNAWFEVYTK